MLDETYDVCVVGDTLSSSLLLRELSNLDEDVNIVSVDTEYSSDSKYEIINSDTLHIDDIPDDVIESKVDTLSIQSENRKLNLEHGDEIAAIVDTEKFKDWQISQIENDNVWLERGFNCQKVNQNGIVTLQGENSSIKSRFAVLATGYTTRLAEYSLNSYSKPDEVSVDYYVVSGEVERTEFGVELNSELPEDSYLWTMPLSGDEYLYGAKESSIFSDLINDMDADIIDSYTISKPNVSDEMNTVYDNVAILGPTVAQSDPLRVTDYGFIQECAKSLSDSISDVNGLSKYHNNWKDSVRDDIQNRILLKDIVSEMDDSEYDRFIHSIQDFELNSSMPTYEVPRIIWHSIKNDPGLFTQTMRNHSVIDMLSSRMLN